MKKYIITSPKFIGELIFGFIDDQLVFMDISSVKHDSNMIGWAIHNLPKTYSQLEAWLKKSSTMKITLMPIDLSFGNFWNVYGKAYGAKVGNKPKSEKLWSKMDDEKKTIAIMNAEPYKKAKAKEGTAMLYPERYLLYEAYLNEF